MTLPVNSFVEIKAQFLFWQRAVASKKGFFISIFTLAALPSWWCSSK